MENVEKWSKPEKTNESLKNIMTHVIMIDKIENRWGNAWKQKTKCTLYCVIKTQIRKMKCNKNTRKISAVVRICLLRPYWRNMEKRKMKQTFKKQDKIFVQQPKHKGPPQSTRCKPLRSKWTVEEHHDQQDWKIIGEHLENWKPSSFIKKNAISNVVRTRERLQVLQ
jgi:hypothetical protein